MEQRMNYLLSNELNGFFNNFASPGIDNTLAIALRYIAIRRSGGDIEKLKPIAAYRHHSPSNVSFTDCIEADFTQNIEVCMFVGCGKPELPNPLPTGWKELPESGFPVCTALMKASKSADTLTSIYINEELKKAFIFVEKETAAWTKLFITLLYRILLWHFPKGKFFDKDEENFFRAVAEDNADIFYELTNKTQSIIDFKTLRAREQLSAWGLGSYKIKIAELTNEVESTREQIKGLTEQLFAETKKLTLSTQILAALEHSPPQDNNELFEFFNEHKQLSIISVEKGETNHLFFQVCETVEYYDKDVFLDAYRNNRSYFFASHTNSEEMRELVFNLFSKERGRLRVGCVFKLSDFTALEPVTNANTLPYVMPHTHLDRHGCLGGNLTKIAEAIKLGYWEIALNQAIAAAKNLNFGDTIVMKNMVAWLNSNMGTKNKIIIADNGNEMTPREFLAYIKEDNTNG